MADLSTFIKPTQPAQPTGSGGGGLSQFVTPSSAPSTIDRDWHTPDPSEAFWSALGLATGGVGPIVGKGATAFLRAGGRALIARAKRGSPNAIKMLADEAVELATKAKTTLTMEQFKLGQQMHSLGVPVDKAIEIAKTLPPGAKVGSRKFGTSLRELGVSTRQKAEAGRRLTEEAFLKAGGRSRFGVFHSFEQMMDHILPGGGQQWRETRKLVDRGAGWDEAITQVFGSRKVLEDAIRALPTGNERRVASETLRQVRGRGYATQGQRTMHALGRLINTVTSTIVLGPITAVKQIGALASVAMELPTRDMVKGVAKMLVNWQDARRAGAIVNDVRTLIRAPQVTHPIFERTSIERVADVAENISERMPWWGLIRKADALPRVIAYHGKLSELTRNAHRAAAGNRKAAEFLSKEGVDLRKVQAGAESTLEHLRTLAAQYADRANLRVDPSSLPAIYSTPGFEAFRGLTTFDTQITRRMYQHLLKPGVEALVKRDMKGLVDFATKGARLTAWSTVIGALVAETLGFMRQKQRPNSMAGLLARAWSSVGTLGMFESILVAMIDPKTGELVNDPDEALQGLGRGLKRMGESRTGAGLGFIPEIPQKLTTPTQRITLVPGVGQILKGQADVRTGRKPSQPFRNPFVPGP